MPPAAMEAAKDLLSKYSFSGSALASAGKATTEEKQAQHFGQSQM
jgi:hypothetical protein